MKTAGSIFGAARSLALTILLAATASCSTYNSKTADIELNLYNGNFKEASARLDDNKLLNKDRNKLLYLLEKGKVEHLQGNFEASNKYLEQAYIMVDDKIQSTTGQYVAAKFTNPMAEPYKGEDFEKVTIHYYKALNYFHLGQPAEALVEAKRINIKLYELNEKYKDNKNKYSEDAFSQILQGIIYESTGDVNNAFIAYRNAEEIYAKNDGKFFGTPMPQQLKNDLMRTARIMGFREEYEKYVKKYGDPKLPQQRPAGEAIIFWENGLGPAKDQVVITASGDGGAFVGTYNDGEISQPIFIPIPTGVDIGVINAIAIPKYRIRPTYYNRATVTVNGNEQPLELGQDFYPIARQCLNDRMLREAVDIAVRFAAKKASSVGLGAIADQTLGKGWGDVIQAGADIANASTEKADTRNWQTLPSTINYTRVPLKEGDNSFVIKKYGPNGVIDTETITITFRPGLQLLNFYDLGRTEIIAHPKAQPTTENEQTVIQPK
ncbi:MAG: COG3014 family protein [Flavobacterium sp.]